MLGLWGREGCWEGVRDPTAAPQGAPRLLHSTVTKAEAEGGFHSPLLAMQVYLPASSGVVRWSRRLPSTRMRTRAWRWLEGEEGVEEGTARMGEALRHTPSHPKVPGSAPAVGKVLLPP